MQLYSRQPVLRSLRKPYQDAVSGLGGTSLMERTEMDDSVVPLAPVAPLALDEPALTSDELAHLSIDYANNRDPRLRDELILHHQRLVRSIASRFLGAGEAFEDLVQVGNIGLINALDRYDPAQGTRFSTYATPTIIGEIKRYFRDKTSGIKVPRWLVELNQATRRTAQALTTELGRMPTLSEIANRLGTTEEEIAEALESSEAANMVSLDTHLDGHSALDSITLLDLIGSEDANLSEFENFGDLRTAIGALDVKEQEVISLRFFDELSQAKIAQRMNVSQMHVSRLQQRALRRLRVMLSEESRMNRLRRVLDDSSPAA